MMILKKHELRRHLKTIGLTDKGLTYVMRCYSSMAPSRKGSGYFGCVHDTYASRKNGFTVNSESRHCEAPFLLWCEFNPNVLLYLDQPEPIKITYYRNGKKVSHNATYDFLVIEKEAVYVVECKPEATLTKLTLSHPNKYTKTCQSFESPPAINAYCEMAIGHRIITTADFPVYFTRNAYYLLNFVDNGYEAKSEDLQAIQRSIRRVGNRIRLKDLTQLYPQILIISGILQSKLFFDADRELLFEPDTVWIYENPTYLTALNTLINKHNLLPITQRLDLENQPTVWWNNKPHTVTSFISTVSSGLSIKSNDGVIHAFTDTGLNMLIENKSLYVPAMPASTSETNTVLVTKSPKQIEKALERYQMLYGDNRNQIVSDRTIKRLEASFKEAEERHGDGFLGLVDNNDKKGNRKPKISQAVISLMETFFEKALIKSPPRLKRHYDDFVTELEKRHLPVCSHKTFYLRFGQYVPLEKKTLLQKGARAAYALGPKPREIDFDKSLPHQGDYAFQFAHIDHTPIEMTFTSKLNGELLTAVMQLTVMFDSFSRKILALHASFEKPSYRSTMVLLRECFERHGVLPIMIVVDRGADFQSVYFDKTLAYLGVNKRMRPVGYFRHGSNVERIFGIAESEFIHCLQGNKQLQKLGRSISTTHNPIKQALWTPDDFYTALKEYAYLIYPNAHRAGICDTPENRFRKSIESFEEKPGVKVKSKQSFYAMTLPDVKSKDGCLVLNKNQITFKYINYQLSRVVPNYNGKKCRVPVKYDPYDIRKIWANINDHWVELFTDDILVRECYDKGVRHAHLEVYPRGLRQKQQYLKGKSSPALSLASIEEKEQLLFNQAAAPVTDDTEKDSNNGSPYEINLDAIPVADVEVIEEFDDE